METLTSKIIKRLPVLSAPLLRLGTGHVTVREPEKAVFVQLRYGGTVNGDDLIWLANLLGISLVDISIGATSDYDFAYVTITCAGVKF